MIRPVEYDLKAEWKRSKLGRLAILRSYRGKPWALIVD